MTKGAHEEVNSLVSIYIYSNEYINHINNEHTVNTNSQVNELHYCNKSKSMIYKSSQITNYYL